MSILALYAWARFIPTGYNLPIGMAVSDIAAGVAALTSIASFVFYLWLPRKKTEIVATSMYALIVLAICTLIVTSDGLSSPFIATWFGVALFSGFFGSTITMAMGGLVVLQIIVTYLTKGMAIPDILAHLISGFAPLILSFIIWHRQPNKKSKDSLADLAHKLSSVEGKSDVVINTIDDGVVAINNSGIIDLINPSAQKLIGWTKGDALDLDWRSVLRLADESGREIEENTNPIAQALATNKPTHSDKLFLLTGSGKKRLVSIMSSPVGSINSGIIVVFRDITKEKAEEREQAEFISTASHEMRTPVASIEGYLGLALNPATANIDDKARDFITKAHESAQHLGKLFQDLLDISKSDDGRLKNDPKVIDVSATVGNIFEGLSHLATEKNLRGLFKPNPSLDDEEDAERRLQPVFYADVDPTHFREVVSNLIENAIKYTHRGDVIVDVTGDDKIVTVSVQDTGIGIPAEDIPHLFQKFYRVDNSDTREIGGTGLGLYLSRRLAETIGGNLRVESEYKKGSTFYLDIPRIDHEEAMQKINDQQEETPEIIIEDDRQMLPEQPPVDPETQPAPQNYPPVPSFSAPTPDVGHQTYAQPENQVPMSPVPQIQSADMAQPTQQTYQNNVQPQFYTPIDPSTMQPNRPIPTLQDPNYQNQQVIAPPTPQYTPIEQTHLATPQQPVSQQEMQQPQLAQPTVYYSEVPQQPQQIPVSYHPTAPQQPQQVPVETPAQYQQPTPPQQPPHPQQ